ncbi:MAG: hypothetical protein ACLPZM_05560 [Thermoplasmata archaeon]
MSGRSGTPERPRSPAGEDAPDLSFLIPDSRAAADLPSDPAAPPAAPVARSGTPLGEIHGILEELDRLSDDLRRRPSANDETKESRTKDSATKVSPTEEWEESAVASPEASPYLEERLAVASASVSALSRELRDLGDRWQGLEEAAQRLEQEIGNANREMGFLRLAEGGVPETRGLASPVPIARSKPDLRPTPHGPAPYGAFTIARYNSTIGGVKARRRPLAWWTVVLAAGISSVLVYLAFVAHEAMPAIWLAALPVVWMIPVPFFILSFLATQRVLRRNHLDLAGDP